MNGIDNSFHIAGNRLAITIRKKCRHLALVQPGHHRGMKSFLTLSRIPIVPRSQLQPAPVMAGAEYEDVPFAQPHTLSLLGGLQLSRGHRLPGLEPLDAT